MLDYNPKRILWNERITELLIIEAVARRSTMKRYTFTGLVIEVVGICFWQVASKCRRSEGRLTLKGIPA